ncbi:MAG: helix-turn-helix transcriptional regulator [Candidatus Manganitrophaceae bacterium]
MKKKDYKIGSGNVFADIGVPNADEHLIKAQLVYKIGSILEERGLTQSATAKLLGVKQPDISNMLRGQFRQFSVERLLRFLVVLNHDVEIVVKEHHDTHHPPTLSVAMTAR